MFGNNANNKNDSKKSTNTRSLQFYNKDGFDPSTLVLGYWDSFLSIKMHPAKDPAKQTENDIYDYDKAINTALTSEKAQALLNNIEKVILPALEAGECRVVGVPVGGNNIITVSTLKINDKVVPAIGIIKGLNDRRVPEASCSYEFKSTQLIDHYDAKSGDYESHNEFVELTLFINYLRNGIASMTNAFTHSNRYVEQWSRSREIENWKALMAHLNIQQEGYGGGGYRRGGGNPFGGGSNKPQASEDTMNFDAPIDTVGSLDDITF